MGTTSGQQGPGSQRDSGNADDGRPKRLLRDLLAIPAAIVLPFVVVARTLGEVRNDQRTRHMLFAALWLLAAGTIIFMILEDLSPVDAFYFSFITLATIGYGDFAPTSEFARLVTVVYSVAGLGILAALIRTVSTKRLTADRVHKTELVDDPDG